MTKTKTTTKTKMQQDLALLVAMCEADFAAMDQEDQLFAAGIEKAIAG